MSERRGVAGLLSVHKTRLVVVGLVTVLVALWAWYTLRSGRADSMAIAECSDLYAWAATAADTLAVDSAHPIQALTRETTCGSLRADSLMN